MLSVRRASRARLAVIATFTALTVLIAGCGDGSDDDSGADAPAADTAAAVCGMLRGWSNELADSLNATSDAITDADDPASANQVLLDGWDGLITIAEVHVTEAEDLELPDTDVRDDLVSELTDGAEQAVTELQEERAGIAALPPITIDAQRGALGGAFTSLEKADSVVEPQIGAYDDEDVKAAFADEPDCEHVIQPF
jgi:hypothetical protein